MRFSALIAATLLAAALCVVTGSVAIPMDELLDARWHYIVWQSRLPAAVTALLTGAALGACGLLLQSYFRNPLAGPSILGITSGANLVVALFALTLGLTPGLPLALASLVGAAGVLMLLLAISRRVSHPATLLIVGLLISYLASALVTLLTSYATAQGVRQLMLWGMGTFHAVGTQHLPLYALLIVATLVGCLWLVKPLNGWMLGPLYARSLGVNTRRLQLGVLGCAGLLAALTTAWCGPIAFVGLSMPHVARLLFRTDDHRTLLPASMLLGALCCAVCLALSTLPSGGTLLPINALTPLFGVPVVLYVLLGHRHNSKI